MEWCPEVLLLTTWSEVQLLFQERGLPRESKHLSIGDVGLQQNKMIR